MNTIVVPGSSRHAVWRPALSIRLAAACAVLLFARLSSAQLGTVTLISPANGGYTTATPTLKWAAFPSASSYWVQIYVSETRQVYNQYTSLTQVTVSPALQTGIEFGWYVVAYNNGGNPIADSDEWFFSVSGAPALSISKTHVGNFTQGQAGATYTVTVSNNGLSAGPTSGTVTVTETAPPGLSLVSMAGTGWTCAGKTCTRSDVLAAGSSYPAITVTVNVATSATSPQVNAVSVSGGGSGSANATDSTSILPPASVSCNPQSGTYTSGQQYSTTCTVSGETGPVSWTFSALPSWLQISSMLYTTCTLSGTVPSPPPNSYSVTVTATGYPGTYPVPTASTTVTINVLVSSTGTLGVSPTSLSYSVTAGVVPPPQNLTITSTSGTLSWNAATALTNSAPANWISASPASGSASPGSPGSTTVSILPIVTTFPTGTYTANVSISSGGQIKTAAVTMSVVQNYLVLPQKVMVFAALVNAPGPPVQTLPVSTSAGTVPFSSQIQYPTPLPPAQWLSASQASPSAPTYLTVSVQPSGLPAGTYIGYVNLVTTTTYPVSVTLVVEAAPDDTYTFNYQIGGAMPAPATVQLTSGGTPVSVLAGAGSDQNNWLSVSPTTAVIPAIFTVTASPGSLPVGQYKGTLAFTDLLGDTAVDLFILSITPVATQTVQTISHIADGGGWSTSIILVNTGAQPASFTLQVTGDNGAAIARSSTGLGMLSTTGTIPVGGSTIISTDGTAAQLSEGWARVTSAQSIDGTAIFRSAQPKGSAVPYQEAAVPLLTAGSSTLLFPFDNNANLATGVALAAPDNSTATTVTWRQRNQAGQNLTSSAEQPVTLPPFGHTAFVLPVDSALAANLRGVAEFDSPNGSIFGLGIRSNSGAFTSVEAVTSQPPATKIISHIADGGSWKTTIILVNTDTVAATFTVNLWQDNGNPFAVQLVGSSAQSSISGVIPVGGTYTIETADVASQTTTGWAEVLSNQSIGGTAIFRETGSGQEAAVPLLTKGGMKLMLPFDSGSGFALGVALANPSVTQDATITYTLRDQNGNAIPNNPPQSISLPRHQHTSLVLPVNLNGAAELKGVVEFDSPNGAVFVLGIRSNNGAFTSVRALGQ